MRNLRKVESGARRRKDSERSGELIWDLTEEEVDTGETSFIWEAMRLMARWLVREHLREKSRKSADSP